MSKILKNSSPGDLNGFLDAGCEVQGDLRFENTFRVHGRFNGTVESDGELIVGEGGVLDGVVKVGELSVSGRLEGRVQARRRIEIGVNGHVEGEISSPVLVIASGAFFQGQCNMSPSEDAASSKPAIVADEKPAPAKGDADPALQRFAVSGGTGSTAGAGGLSSPPASAARAER